MKKTVKLPVEGIYTGELILVNREHPLREGRKPPGLLRLNTPCFEDRPVLMEKRAAVTLEKILAEMKAGKEITAVSGWRSKEEQSQIFGDSLQKHGPEFTGKYVACPGTSEHQTGLAIDLALTGPKIDGLCPYFPYEGVCGVFREKALQYGFIERYPSGKESVTGIAHEPWHFRYTGTPHAGIMAEQGLTLEEYHALLRQYPYGKKPLQYSVDGIRTEIFFVEAEDMAEEADGAANQDYAAAFTVEENLPYLISGDNAGGFIVTLWR